MRRFLISAIITLILVFSTMSTANNPSTNVLHLRFGLYTSSNPTALVRQFHPILRVIEDELSQKLHRPVDITINLSRTYEDGIDAIVTGRVDFARFGPASYVQAKLLNPNLQLIAIETVEGGKVFYGVIVVQEGSDITTVEDLRGKSFAFGNENSTIGRYLSQLFLAKANIRVGDLASYAYLQQHDLVGLAVAMGEFDAGALNETIFRKLAAAGQPLTEIVRFENVTKPWIATPEMDPEVRAALEETLLEILPNNIGARRLQITGFVRGEDSDYDTIREIIEQNDQFFEDE